MRFSDVLDFVLATVIVALAGWLLSTAGRAVLARWLRWRTHRAVSSSRRRGFR